MTTDQFTGIRSGTDHATASGSETGGGRLSQRIAGRFSRAACTTVELIGGAGTAVLGLAFLLTAGLLYAGAVVAGTLRGGRPGAAAVRCSSGAAARWTGRGAHRLARLERRRLGHTCGLPPVPTGTPRLVRYLAARIQLGLLGGAVLVLTAGGAVMAITMAVAWATGSPGTGTGDVLLLAVLGPVLLHLALRGLAGIAETDHALARRLSAPAPHEALHRRIDELATSRAGVVAAVHEERRRIERDLHDGVQQRLVALGMLLGRARRVTDRDRADDLLRQAHEQAQQALVDLREVAWRIHPTGLDDGGLRTVLETLAEHAPMRVTLEYAVDPEPPPIVATAAYFVVAEALTNAAKHGGAGAAAVSVTGRREDGGRLFVRVTDGGTGGADPSGGGLSGLARRVAALDGDFRVSSPAGGPTTITAELPCA